MKKRFYISNNLYSQYPIQDAKYLYVTGILDDSIIHEIEKENINVVVLNNSLGCNIHNFEILKKLPEQLIGLNILGFVFNFSNIYHLRNLKYFSYNAYTRQTIDFLNFPKLEKVYLEWWPQAVTIFKCGLLKDLYLSSYKNPNLNDVSELVNLEKLRITNSPINDLSNIEKLKKIESLGLHYLRKLDDLSNIGHLFGLKCLDLSGINKKEKDISFIYKLKELEELNLDNCGKIKSLKPVENLKKIKVLWFAEDTNIIDGDLDFLKNMKSIKKIAFANRKHYSLRSEEIRNYLHASM